MNDLTSNLKQPYLCFKSLVKVLKTLATVLKTP